MDKRIETALQFPCKEISFIEKVTGNKCSYDGEKREPISEITAIAQMEQKKNETHIQGHTGRWFD